MEARADFMDSIRGFIDGAETLEEIQTTEHLIVEAILRKEVEMETGRILIKEAAEKKRTLGSVDEPVKRIEFCSCGTPLSNMQLMLNEKMCLECRRRTGRR